jgi:hypothetical protein
MLTIVTPAASEHLTTLARAKTELGITGSSDDNKILDFISEASSLIAEYCGRDGFGRASYEQTERLACAVNFIVLDRDIGVEITQITAAGTVLTTDDYELDGTLLYRLTDDERVAWETGKIVIEYDAGYDLLDSMPFAIERACLDLVVNLYRASGRDGSVRMDSVEGVGSVAYFDVRSNAGVMPLSADRITALDRYKLWAIR